MRRRFDTMTGDDKRRHVPPEWNDGEERQRDQGDRRRAQHAHKQTRSHKRYGKNQQPRRSHRNEHSDDARGKIPHVHRPLSFLRALSMRRRRRLRSSSLALASSSVSSATAAALAEPSKKVLISSCSAAERASRFSTVGT